jgi:hypothetical protein
MTRYNILFALNKVCDVDDNNDNNSNNNNNTVCAQLHFNVCKELGVKLDKEHWYEHVQKPVETSHEGNVITLWNQQVQTDRTIRNNKPGIIIRDKGKGTCRRRNFKRLECDQDSSREDSKI